MSRPAGLHASPAVIFFGLRSGGKRRAMRPRPSPVRPPDVPPVRRPSASDSAGRPPSRRAPCAPRTPDRARSRRWRVRRPANRGRRDARPPRETGCSSRSSNHVMFAADFSGARAESRKIAPVDARAIRHRVHQPLQCHVAARRRRGKEPPCLLGEIEKDRRGLRQRQRLAVWSVRIDDHGNRAGGIELQEFGGALLALRTGRRFERDRAARTPRA